MKLTKYFLMSLASLTLTSAALAYGGGRHNPRPAPQPYPQQPLPPGRGNYPQPGYGSDRTEQRSALLNRRFSNESIPLRQILGLNQNYQNYSVDSVVLDIPGGMVNSTLDLVINGRVEQTLMMPQGRVVLTPQVAGALLGNDPNSLRLVVRGMIDISAVTVNLRTRTNGGGFEQRITVPLFAARRLLGNGQLDLTPMIDMYRYNGYRIEAIEIVANSLFSTALLDVMINGYQAAPSIFVVPNAQLSVVRPMNAILGQTVNSLVLQNRGDLDVREVRLQLIGR